MYYFKEPVFNDRIEAWQYGPTIPNAYYWFKNNKVLKKDVYLNINLKNLVDNVLKCFNERSTFYLVDLTMSFESWKRAWFCKFDNQIFLIDIIECHKELSLRNNGYIF